MADKENLLETVERKLWNGLAVGFGVLLCPLPTRIASRSRGIAGWHFRARDEIAPSVATAFVSSMGMGDLHRRRMRRIRKTVFGEDCTA